MDLERLSRNETEVQAVGRVCVLNHEARKGKGLIEMVSRDEQFYCFDGHAVKDGFEESNRRAPMRGRGGVQL